MTIDARQGHRKSPSFQADPGEYYALYTLELFGAGEVLLASAQLVSTNIAVQAPPPLLPGRETWSVPSAFLTNLSAAEKLVIRGVELTDPPELTAPPGTSLFTMAGAVDWSASEPPFPEATFFGDGDRGGVGLMVAVSPPASSTEPWTGSMQWYLLPEGGRCGPYAFGPSSEIVMRRLPPAQSELWYSVTVAPAAIP